uniref:RNase H type-1 domain-containing protein n=1 Tax=Cannabis sativa TaxID=3483 RepID=A0A803PIL3_CANSA
MFTNCSRTVLVESDSLIGVKALETKALPFAWGSYPAFFECCNLVSLFDVCVVSFIPRVDNSVADTLARYSRVSSVNSRCLLREIAPFVAIAL